MVLEGKHIQKNYGKKSVLKDVSFCADTGECVGIIGKNGAGKSSLISIIAGTLKPSGGQFFLNGQPVSATGKELPREVAYVPQANPLMDELSARDNLMLWYSGPQMQQSLKDGALKRLGIDEFLKVRVKDMSGGMKKRLSIGCAMAANAHIMLLDEPGAALDLQCKIIIRDFIAEFKAKGGTVIMASHEPEEIAACDRLYVLKDGVLTDFNYSGDIKELINGI